MELGIGLSEYIPIVIYLSAIVCAVMSIAKRVEFGIYFYVFFLPLQNILNYTYGFPMGKDLNDILLASMMVGWVLRKRESGEPFFEKTALNIPLLILCIYTFVETWRGGLLLGHSSPLTKSNPVFVAWKNYMFSPLIYLIIVNNLKKPQQIRILVVIMVLSILALDRNFYNVIRYRDTSHYDENYLKVVTVGTALGGNWLAVFLAQYSVIVLALFLLDDTKWLKLLYVFVIILSFYCIMFLFSRSGYLAVVAGLAVIGFMRDRRILIALCLVLLTWTTVLPTAVRERISMTYTNEGWDRTTMQRLGMWEQAKSLINEQPVLGHGFDMTSQMAVKDDENSDYAWNSFHNNYLQTIVELGYAGLLLLLIIYFIGFHSGWQLYKIGRTGLARGLGLGVMACVPAILAGNIAGSYWQYYNIIGFFYVFLALVHRLKINQDSISSKVDDAEKPDTEDVCVRTVNQRAFKRVPVA